ncbi:PREDICTED: uncharacterized protein LOC103589996 [Galeopterus variegatus]|uniref:Uncharacterized protein LOC103589996 n=1 Tax=Galeopterus variegatus TaxID=482537 RepID=A0ABM0QPP2_GALVR|nr:PREDICTED: uncharacterized protein LOC103589996 [Galeopterus variegatus]
MCPPDRASGPDFHPQGHGARRAQSPWLGRPVAPAFPVSPASVPGIPGSRPGAGKARKPRASAGT